jgi:chromosomal replication initiation ATPase DnaA
MTYNRVLETKITRLTNENKFLSEQASRLRRENRELKQGKGLLPAEVSLQYLVREVVNEFFGVDIEKTSRVSKVVNARQYYYQYLKMNTALTLKDISRTLALYQHHTTIINCLKCFEEFYSTDPLYKKNYESVLEIIDSRLNPTM